jgi:hypothetical protein
MADDYTPPTFDADGLQQSLDELYGLLPPEDDGDGEQAFAE